MGLGARASLAASLGFAAAFVVACGGGNGLLSGDQANSLNAELASVSSAVSSGDCGAANAAAQRFTDQVGQLSRNVSTTLIQNLGQGAQTVSELAARDCRNAGHTTTTTTTTATHTTPTTTTTVTATTTATQTTPTTTTTTTAPPTGTATNPPGTGTNSNGGAGLTGGHGGGGANQNGQ